MYIYETYVLLYKTKTRVWKISENGKTAVKLDGKFNMIHTKCVAYFDDYWKILKEGTANKMENMGTGMVTQW